MGLTHLGISSMDGVLSCDVIFLLTLSPQAASNNGLCAGERNKVCSFERFKACQGLEIAND